MGNGTIRKLGYSFIFAFHNNDGCILHHFEDKARYWSKVAISSYPLAFDAPAPALPPPPPVGILTWCLVWKN